MSELTMRGGKKHKEDDNITCSRNMSKYAFASALLFRRISRSARLMRQYHVTDILLDANRPECNLPGL